MSQIRYFEIEFNDGNDNTAMWMCIKGIREPSICEAAEFCKYETKMYGLPVAGVYPIDETEARSVYDFEKEQYWPIFGAI